MLGLNYDHHSLEVVNRSRLLFFVCVCVTSLAFSDYSSVYYNALNKRLFVSGDLGQDDYTSVDDGATWSQWSWGNPKGGAMTGYGGYAFSDRNTGVVSSIHDHDPCYYTTDGGASWNTSNIVNAAGAQPVAITGTQTFFLTDVFGSQIWMTIDGGKTWTHATDLQSSSTTVLEGDAEMIAAQSNISVNNDGMYVSLDVGKTWVNVCGPSANYGNIFYVRGYTIIASDAGTQGAGNPDPVAAFHEEVDRNEINITCGRMKTADLDMWSG